jgi:N-methylhydantoinase A
VRLPIRGIAVDVGGTFTDLVAEDVEHRFHIYKSSTRPDDPVQGVLDVLDVAAEDRGRTVRELLADVDLFIHGTTRATNAIIDDTTAKTALFVTAGHPDILLWREGTRVGTFDYDQENPEPYVPRSLTFEVQERGDVTGSVVVPLDETVAIARIAEARSLGVEAVAVCFLWSPVNGAHERRMGELLEEYLPGVPYTLSHALMPTVREYRRASAASIDASLKPLMTGYLSALTDRLRAAGLRGRLLMMTSSGYVRDVDDVAAAPIHSTSSGPAAAPVAGRFYADIDGGSDTAIITDAGGTSYDVGLVRNGVIPITRQTTLGVGAYGHMTGFSAVDIRSIGAGGGSIASVDDGGMLHVGPRSAGAVPGPACYGRGGTEATITDACLVLGYLDPGYFLGGRMTLDPARAVAAVEEHVAIPLGMSLDAAAAAVVQLQVEHMVGAIEAITLNQGVDPAKAVLIGGGGSAGFYSGAIARQLRCPRVVMPEPVAALSAVGALLSGIGADYVATVPTATDAFELEGVNAALAELTGQCEAFASEAAGMTASHVIQIWAEARYRDQVWELDVPLGDLRTFRDQDDVATLRALFDRTHAEILGHDDPGSEVEVVAWRAEVNCTLRERTESTTSQETSGGETPTRSVYFRDTGRVEAQVIRAAAMPIDHELCGPLIIQSPVTTIVVEPGYSATRHRSGSIVMRTPAADATHHPERPWQT